MICTVPGCEYPATHGCVAVIPSQGQARRDASVLTIIMEVKRCALHARCQASELLTSLCKEAIDTIAYSSGHAMLDFRRAKIVPLSLDHPEYLQFEALRATQQ